MNKARVVLFQRSGKYYTEEEWQVPDTVPDYSHARGHYVREVLIPADMIHSPDFHRIDGGPVLVHSARWGYPHLLV